MEPLTVLEPSGASDALKDYVRHSLAPRAPLEVLEAGCGRNSELGLEGVPHRLVGVDVDVDALRWRREKWGDLDEEIVGDLRTLEFAAESFDVIFSAWVLEHVDGAETVLDNFVRWLRPGGVMVLRIPDGDTVFGRVTKHSPHKVHVLYKRWIQGRPNAGKPGFGPYPTVYDPVISRRGIRAYFDRHGLEVVREDGIAIAARKLGRYARPIQLFMRTVDRLSGGRIPGEHVNLQYVVRKPG